MNEMRPTSAKIKGPQADENHVFDLAPLTIIPNQVYSSHLDRLGVRTCWKMNYRITYFRFIFDPLVNTQETLVHTAINDTTL